MKNKHHRHGDFFYGIVSTGLMGLVIVLSLGHCSKESNFRIQRAAKASSQAVIK